MTDEAFWSRWEYIPFANSFPRDDGWAYRTFTPPFTSGLLNAQIGMAFRIHDRHNLVIDSDPSEVLTRWTVNADPILRFVNEHFIITGGVKDTEVKLKVWNAWKRYVEQHSADIPQKQRPASIEVFCKRLFHYGFVDGGKKRVGESVKRVFRGISFKRDSDLRDSSDDDPKLIDY